MQRVGGSRQNEISYFLIAQQEQKKIQTFFHNFSTLKKVILSCPTIF